ncbi:MAG TPA: hypothetical protein VG942_10155 [Hyphomonadaceae bacterium]|nr:hypothetical protein [Hyphomonadaceae bacterium]
MTADKLRSGAFVARTDTAHQFLVRIPHGLEANSENRLAWPTGQFIKAALLSTFMHPAATFAEPFIALIASGLSEPGFFLCPTN